MSSKFLFLLAVILSIIICSSASMAVTYEFDYNGEPAGDVKRFNEYGNVTISDEYPEIDLKKFETQNGTGDNWTFTLGTKAKRFTTSEGVKYVIRIFTRSDNSTGYNITYRNGSIEIARFIGDDEQTPEDISDLGGIVKVKNEELLIIDVPKTKYLLGESLTFLNVDAFSWMEVGNFTYIDYIHNLPGNPGTIAPDIAEDPDLSGGSSGDDDSDKGGSTMLILIPIIIIVIVVILLLILMRSKKKY
jgi:hypothetical protein